MPEKNENRDRALTTEDLLTRAKDANEFLLLSKPNVIGLDIGFRVKNGTMTDEEVVTVHVVRKLPESMLAKEHVIPTKIKIGAAEVPVDVVEGNLFQGYQEFTLRSRPLRGGLSISGAQTGTLGTCVKHHDGQTYLLSCFHILRGFTGPNVRDHRRAPILQPGSEDGGTEPQDVVAESGGIAPQVPLDFGTTTIQVLGLTFDLPNPNYVDAALALVTNGYNDADRQIHWIGYPTPLRSSFVKALRGRRVCKMGRTTGFTTGRVKSQSADVFNRPYGPFLPRVFMKDQILIEDENGPFARPGDSGALVVDVETQVPVGLIWGGDNMNLSGASPIRKVMELLEIPEI